MAAARWTLIDGVILLTLSITFVTSVYVRSGSDFTDCNMTCLDTRDVLVLYRVCGAVETKLLELWCNDSWSYNHFDPRLHLNTSSGCLRLTDVRKKDSGLYVLLRHSRSGSFRRSTDLTVLDPVLISNITSNSSRLGQDIAVSVQLSGEMTAVTWTVDGGSLPDRYRLIDDNRTLIIPSAQREDARRRLHVRITNPVSEETREYQLEITDYRYNADPWTPRPYSLVVPVFAAAVLVVVIPLLAVDIAYRKKRKNVPANDVEMKQTNGPSEENGHPPRADQSDVTEELLDSQNAHEMNKSMISGV